MATDLAEFLGAAIGFNLLIGTSLFVSCILTAIVAFTLLALQSYGFRRFEAAIATLVGLIGVCYLIEMVYSRPDFRAAGEHLLVPQFAGSESVLLAVGILGATVMPHVIYLHSALTQDRIVPESRESARVLMRYTRIDVLDGDVDRRPDQHRDARDGGQPRSTSRACTTSPRSRPPTRRSSRSSAPRRARCSRSRCSAPASPRRPSARLPARS